MESPTSRKKREKWGTLMVIVSAHILAQRKKWAPGIFYEIKKERPKPLLIVHVHIYLEYLHILCLEALGPLGYVELHSLTFLQATETA